MVENDIFTNLPLVDILKALTSDERQCFTAFMSANLLLRQDIVEGVSGIDDVLNFTYEQIRDYLLTRHLVDVVYPADRDRFLSLVEQYTAESNSLAEGTRMFLFLYVRSHGKNEVHDLIKTYSWYDSVLIGFIWNISDEKITQEDVGIVKAYLRGHADDIVKVLTYTHWSPEINKNLNINTLFDVLEEKGKDDRAAYLEAVWPSKPDHHSFFGESVVTPRGEFISEVRAGIQKRKKKKDKELEALELLEKYLREGEEMDKLYISRPTKKSKSSPLVLYAYESYCYLMRVHKGKKEDFLAMAGVKDGYAKEMFSSIYDAIFAEARDVVEMYQDYYSNEYKDFGHFLSMHYSIPSNRVRRFAKVKEEKDYRLIEFDALSYGGDTVSGLVMSDELIARMYNWLNWQNDEDKD